MTGNGATGAGDDASGSDETVLTRVLREDVRALLRVLHGSAVEELRIERPGKQITLRRRWDLHGETTAQPAPPPPPSAGEREGLNRLAMPGRTEVRAHVVGVFHRTRDVDRPALAHEGDLVESGTAVGVIETLGIASDVTAPLRGRLTEYLVKDGEPVEYGEVLAVIVAE